MPWLQAAQVLSMIDQTDLQRDVRLASRRAARAVAAPAQVLLLDAPRREAGVLVVNVAVTALHVVGGEVARRPGEGDARRGRSSLQVVDLRADTAPADETCDLTPPADSETNCDSRF